MAPYIEIPQTPRAKSRFVEETGVDDDIIDGLSAVETGPGKEHRGRKIGRPFLDGDAFRHLSASPFSEPERLSPATFRRTFSPAPQGPITWKTSIRNSWFRFWDRNQSVLLVFAAQLFGALMNLSARLLELDDDGLNPFQLLFVRMGLTAIVSCCYMYKTKVPNFPLGAKEVRWLLVLRGVSGFFGIFGMWYSMMYLPLAEATVITFLVPSVAGYLCHLTIHDPFTRKEQIASFIALAGVILIARPISLFSHSVESTTATSAIDVPGNMTLPHQQRPGEEATQSQRLGAIGVALLGVLGGSGAFTTIRAIGKRAHPLISVNYFSTWCTTVTATVLTFAPILDVGQPALQFGFPHSLRQWGLLLSICTCGFTTQFLMTAGLAGERSNRATAMVYTHMLFAAGFDKWIFGHQMGTISLIGCSFIIGSALWVAVSRKPVPEKPLADVEVGQVVGAETMPMLGDDESDDEDSGIQLEEVR